MKTKSIKISVISSALSVIGIVFIIFSSSCKKSSDDFTNANFTGVFAGRLVSGSYDEADTIVIPASTNSNIAMISHTGLGSTYTINGTINGNRVNFDAQSVQVSGLGTTYTVSGSGTLTDATLVINYTFISPSHATSSWKFTGTR
jgi:hypothetical protein